MICFDGGYWWYIGNSNLKFELTKGCYKDFESLRKNGFKFSKENFVLFFKGHKIKKLHYNFFIDGKKVRKKELVEFLNSFENE